MIKFTRIVYKRWFSTAALLSVLLLLPLMVVVFSAFGGKSESWDHIQQHLLPHFAGATLVLVLGVSLCTAVLGFVAAFLVVFVDLPFKRFFEWALILPLSIPAYLLAFSYADICGYEGWTSRFLGFQPNIMNIWGAIFIFSLALYPYVYLPLKTFFKKSGFAMLETAASLGKNKKQAFVRVIIPMARPVLFGGAFLATVEVLNDFGVVKYFGVPTFTVGIFRAWTGFADITAALRLASLLLLVVFATYWLEKWLGKNKRYAVGSNRTGQQPITKEYIRWTGFLICTVLLLLAFGLPFLQMIFGVVATAERVMNAEFFVAFWHSVQLAATVAFLVVMLGLIIQFSVRLGKSARWTKFPAILSGLGYYIPGAVIALGVLVPLTMWDKFIVRSTGNFDLMLSATITGLIYALLVRYMAVGQQSIQNGYASLSPNLTESSLSLGVGPFRSLFSIDLRLLKNFMISGFILVFIDVLKELPLTMILRPFNYDTLATKAFNLASDELLREAANASILIVLAGMIPVLLLNRSMQDASN